MRVEIKTQQLKRIDALSFYNFNLYQLPVTIDGCDVLLAERGVSEEFVNYQLGTIVSYKFQTAYFLNQEEIDFDDVYETLVIDSEVITTENNRT
jgi:hypothetical protein